MKGLVRFVNQIESVYGQLGKVNELDAVTMTHVDDMSDLLPTLVRKDWMKTYCSLPRNEKIHPFSSFILFLDTEQNVKVRLAEQQIGKPDAKLLTAYF